ncbi:hypothetical protein D3C87_1396820 [compost metagenome]
MGRVVFVSKSLEEAMRQYRDLCATVAMDLPFEDVPEESQECPDFDVLASVVLGVLDPFSLEIPEFDHETFQYFWETVEQAREELFWRRMVRGPVTSIRIMNASGLVFVEYREHELSWLRKRS